MFVVFLGLPSKISRAMPPTPPPPKKEISAPRLYGKFTEATVKAV